MKLNTSQKKYKWLRTIFLMSSQSLAIRELQIKTSLRFHVTPVRMISTEAKNAGEVMSNGENSYTVGRGSRCCSYCEHQCRFLED